MGKRSVELSTAKKQEAQELRDSGKSFYEISKKLNLSYTTILFWFGRRPGNKDPLIAYGSIIGDRKTFKPKFIPWRCKKPRGEQIDYLHSKIKC